MKVFFKRIAFTLNLNVAIDLMVLICEGNLLKSFTLITMWLDVVVFSLDLGTTIF
ncbi:hypothetical protein C0J52_08021 [Blattella germanica]|nr:hypothetical protein C0J52_08021 [Blattella germanica]